MENANTFVDMLVTYGSLGIITAYFMVKDWQLNRKLQETLNEFTVAVNALLGKEFN